MAEIECSVPDPGDAAREAAAVRQAARYLRETDGIGTALIPVNPAAPLRFRLLGWSARTGRVEALEAHAGVIVVADVSELEPQELIQLDAALIAQLGQALDAAGGPGVHDWGGEEAPAPTEAALAVFQRLAAEILAASPVDDASSDVDHHEVLIRVLTHLWQFARPA